MNIIKKQFKSICICERKFQQNLSNYYLSTFALEKKRGFYMKYIGKIGDEEQIFPLNKCVHCN